MVLCLAVAGHAQPLAPEKLQSPEICIRYIVNPRAELGETLPEEMGRGVNDRPALYCAVMQSATQALVRFGVRSRGPLTHVMTSLLENGDRSEYWAEAPRFLRAYGDVMGDEGLPMLERLTRRRSGCSIQRAIDVGIAHAVRADSYVSAQSGGGDCEFRLTADSCEIRVPEDALDRFVREALGQADESGVAYRIAGREAWTGVRERYPMPNGVSRPKQPIEARLQVVFFDRRKSRECGPVEIVMREMDDDERSLMPRYRVDNRDPAPIVAAIQGCK